VTFIQLYYDYKREMNGIDLTFQYIEKSYHEVIASALWHVDLEALQKIDSGLKNLPNIDLLSIRFAEDPATRPDNDHELIQRQVQLYYAHEGRAQLVGSILMGSSIHRVYENLVRKLFIIILSQGAKTFLVAAFMLFIFERLIMRHLRQVAVYARSLHFDNRRLTPSLPLIDARELDGELKDVVDALEVMQRNIERSYLELDVTEGRLRSLNASLEKEVQRRIQENERQQVMIQNSARLSALGEMAGNIAHEINNPLTIIAGYIRIIRSHLDSPRLSPEKLAFFGKKAEETIERISGIVSGLLRLSRGDVKSEAEPHALNQIVDDVANLCRMNFLHQNIRFEVSIPDQPILAKIRPVEIGQILINLINNAHDAVRDRPAPWIKLQLSQKDHIACMAVLDNGPGVPPELRARIMDPFFTTKTYGQGTGLGLSISSAIAQQHAGRIYLDETSAETCFVLELPAIIKPNSPE
jgi:C4-dicarboxylate-specific signal transduction histidine kinase